MGKLGMIKSAAEVKLLTEWLTIPLFNACCCNTMFRNIYQYTLVETTRGMRFVPISHIAKSHNF